MRPILPVRPSSTKSKSLSALLSQSKDDFYGQLQTIMNAVPAALSPDSSTAVGLSVSSAPEK